MRTKFTCARSTCPPTTSGSDASADRSNASPPDTTGSSGSTEFVSTFATTGTKPVRPAYVPNGAVKPEKPVDGPAYFVGKRAKSTSFEETSTNATSLKDWPLNNKTFSNTVRSAPGLSVITTSKPSVSEPPTPRLHTSSEPLVRPAPRGPRSAFAGTNVPPPVPWLKFTTLVANRD